MTIERLSLDEVQNGVDSLETAAAFLDRTDAYRWKWIAMALHHSLYSLCISAISQGNALSVISEKGKRPDDEQTLVERGDGNGWCISTRAFIPGTRAYRIEWKATNAPPATGSNALPDPREWMKRMDEGSLIGFWTALARAQDQYHWMAKLTHSKALQLSDDQIRKIWWLANEVRNEAVHFVPKVNEIDIERVQNSAVEYVNAINFLVFKSNSIVSFRGAIHDRVRAAIVTIAEHFEMAQPSRPP